MSVAFKKASDSAFFLLIEHPSFRVPFDKADRVITIASPYHLNLIHPSTSVMIDKLYNN